MQASEVSRAMAVAIHAAASEGLTVDGAVVLHNSNKLTLRLLPCEVVARVAPAPYQVAGLEVELARRLAGLGGPTARPEPRVVSQVHQRDDFVVTFWTYYPPAGSRAIPPAAYADALVRLHAGMRALDVAVPHFLSRVDSAQELLADRERTPALSAADRQLLGDTLRQLGGAIGDRGDEQLLHGEPHPGNLLATEEGPLFIDLETCCRGPVEFDLAHAPAEVGENYPGVDDDLLARCRILVLAMVTTWRWDREDQLPGGRELGTEWLRQLRAAPAG